MLCLAAAAAMTTARPLRRWALPQVELGKEDVQQVLDSLQYEGMIDAVRAGTGRLRYCGKGS